MKRKFAIVKQLVIAFLLFLIYAGVPVLFICAATLPISDIQCLPETVNRWETEEILTGVGRNEYPVYDNSPTTIYRPALEISDGGIPDSIEPENAVNRLCNQFSDKETGEMFESEEAFPATVDKEPPAGTVYPISPSTEGGWTLQNCTLTAYCSCPMCCNNYITYTGTVVTEGRTVAVDPRVIPLGSIVTIAGHDYVAEDAGVIGNWVDIYFDTHYECVEFGLQSGDVSIQPAN